MNKSNENIIALNPGDILVASHVILAENTDKSAQVAVNADKLR